VEVTTNLGETYDFL